MWAVAIRILRSRLLGKQFGVETSRRVPTSHKPLRDATWPGTAPRPRCVVRNGSCSEFSGYGIQYLRRLLRTGQLEGTKIGQVWLIRLASLETYARNGQIVGDQRYGPRQLHIVNGREPFACSRRAVCGLIHGKTACGSRCARPVALPYFHTNWGREARNSSPPRIGNHLLCNPMAQRCQPLVRAPLWLTRASRRSPSCPTPPTCRRIGQSILGFAQ
jgi:hypothetical protein